MLFRSHKLFCSFNGHFVLLEIILIKCHLSKILGEKRLKIADVVKNTGINRGTVTRMYHETAQRIELDVIDKLCTYLGCSVCELLEQVDD